MPGVRDGAGDHAWVEVVERRGDHVGWHWPERGGAGGEVAHPVALETSSGVCLPRLGREVDQGVVRLQHVPHTARDVHSYWLVGHRYPRSRFAATLRRSFY